MSIVRARCELCVCCCVCVYVWIGWQRIECLGVSMPRSLSFGWFNNNNKSQSHPAICSRFFYRNGSLSQNVQSGVVTSRGFAQPRCTGVLGLCIHRRRVVSHVRRPEHEPAGRVVCHRAPRNRIELPVGAQSDIYFRFLFCWPILRGWRSL